MLSRRYIYSQPATLTERKSAAIFSGNAEYTATREGHRKTPAPEGTGVEIV
jgi:hypothetical protein